MKLFIEPVDVWLFRDGRPFNRGSDHRARSIFPPLPTVMQGVIRTHHIERNGGIPAYLEGKLTEVAQVIGKPGDPPPATFRLKGPFLAQYIHHKGSPFDVDLYFPLPADAYCNGKVYQALELHPPASDVLTDLKQDLLLWPRRDREPEKDEVEGGVWFSLKALQEYLLKGELLAGCVKSGRELFMQERRFGIGRCDNTRAAKEGLLYEADFIRTCQDVGLYVEVEGIGDWDEEGVLGIGGEGHCGYYRRLVNVPEIVHPVSPDAERFKIVFLTPTFLKEGWQADDWEKLFGRRVTFKGAAVNRPLTLGGFDQATKRQKPARRYVPAGSVYFFEGKPPLHLEKNITQNGANIGFGQFIIGGW